MPLFEDFHGQVVVTVNIYLRSQADTWKLAELSR